ncbi:MAG: histidine phosphatase family protein [Paenibacillaceae bacterium]|nr:histidine phosphatase family protein [Paenibacillaceae bacterium]
MVRTVWLLRHGMRQDFEDPDWPRSAPRPHDPPLTASGLQMAAETGARLGNEPIDHVFASPYMRTLQTAAVIADRRGLRVNAEPGFGEWLNPLWFPAMPDIVTPEEASALFPCLDRDYAPYADPAYPEKDEATDMHVRVERALRGVLRDYSGSVLIVGHGSTVRQAARTLGDPPAGIELGLCALNRFDRNDDGWRLALASVDHLTITEQWLRFQ